MELYEEQSCELVVWNKGPRDEIDHFPLWRCPCRWRNDFISLFLPRFCTPRHTAVPINLGMIFGGGCVIRTGSNSGKFMFCPWNGWIHTSVIKNELEWQEGTLFSNISQSPFSWMLRVGESKRCIDVPISMPIVCTVGVGFIGQHLTQCNQSGNVSSSILHLLFHIETVLA